MGMAAYYTYTPTSDTTVDLTVDDTTSTSASSSILDAIWLSDYTRGASAMRVTVREIVREFVCSTINRILVPKNWRWWQRHARTAIEAPTREISIAPTIVRRCRALRDRVQARRWKRRRFLQALASVG